MTKHTPEHAPGCPRNVDWDAASLCDKEPECTCGLSKHTEKAVKTAKHINERQAVVFGRDTWDVDELAGLIDQETGLPEITARIKELEAESTEAKILLENAKTLLEEWSQAYKSLTALAKADNNGKEKRDKATIGDDTIAERDRLREINLELFQACQAALRFQEVIDMDRLPQAIRGQVSPLTRKLRTALTKEPDKGK